MGSFDLRFVEILARWLKEVWEEVPAGDASLGEEGGRDPRTCGGLVFSSSPAENFAPPVSLPPKVPARFLGVQMLAHDYGPNGLAILPSSVWEEGIAWRSSRVPSG